MNKYLKGFLNSIIQLAIFFVGGLFSMNILWAGYLFFPDIVMRTDQVLMGHQAFSSVGILGILDGAVYFSIRFLPLYFILAVMSATVSSLFFMIWLVKGTDIEKIVASFTNSSKTKPKED